MQLTGSEHHELLLAEHCNQLFAGAELKPDDSFELVSHSLPSLLMQHTVLVIQVVQVLHTDVAVQTVQEDPESAGIVYVMWQSYRSDRDTLPGKGGTPWRELTYLARAR